MTGPANDESLARGSAAWTDAAGKNFTVLTEHVLLGRLIVLLEAVEGIGYPEVSGLYGGQPAASSPMEADIRAFGVEAVANVQRVCGTWHMVATECLAAVASVHQDGRSAWAPGPLLRSALEHSARLGWVLHGSDARLRAARSWLADVVAKGEDVRTHLNMGDPVETLADAPERLRHLCEDTLPPLFGETPIRKGDQPQTWTLCGEAWPGYVASAKAFFEDHVEPRTAVSANGWVQYRLASMFSHPSTSAAFSLADQSRPGIAEFRWSWQLTRQRTAVTLIGFYAATDALYEYLGWTPPTLAAWSAHLQRFIAQTEPTTGGDGDAD